MQILNVSYTTIKTVLGVIPSYRIQQGDGGYDLFAVGSEMFIHSKVDSEADVTDFVANHISKCTAVASPDDALVLGSVVNKVPLVQPRTSDGKVRIAHEKTGGDRVNFFSVDYTDPTTWYPQSTRVADEVATAVSGEGITPYTVYSLAHSPIIDTYHAKLTGEDTLRNALGQSYRVSVTVTPSGGSPQAKTEQDPHYGAGGHYTVDYDTGKVTFLSALTETDQVKVTYHWVNMSLNNGTASRFTVAPSAGMKLFLEIAECQFAMDLNPKDTVMFEVWGIADYFLPPAAMAAYGIPAGIGYKIRLQQVKYKSLRDFHNDAFKCYPAYGVMGDPNNWRSQKSPVTVFDWDYLTSIPLSSTSGMEIRVCLEHDEPFEGYMATATFYCKAEPET